MLLADARGATFGPQRQAVQRIGQVALRREDEPVNLTNREADVAIRVVYDRRTLPPNLHGLKGPELFGGVFVSSDDDDATTPVAALVETLGFAPVKLGKLAEGGALVQARGQSWAPLIFQDLFKVAS